ncbi:hypothetical protein EDC04DRAFT_2798674 [Pisolithus marmoratus]|nr:hypothetical protein EDC04DRAFT_2798674 [Pisolithus marmoratus]
MSTNGGFGKLQAFCAIAGEQDYLWAWSDTCCIDKDSSAELQEAIGSMFVWYRRSALTITYLSDVSDTNSNGSNAGGPSKNYWPPNAYYSTPKPGHST